MSVPLRILSVAPRYRMAVDGAHGGHYTVYQDDLRAGAARLGLPLEVLADRRATVDEGASTVLDTTDERTIAASVAGVLRPDDLVMVYEGSLAMVEAFVPVAADRPDVRFVVNLFRPEPGLVPARRSRGRARPSDRVAVRTLSDGGTGQPRHQCGDRGEGRARSATGHRVRRCLAGPQRALGRRGRSGWSREDRRVGVACPCATRGPWPLRGRRA